MRDSRCLRIVSSVGLPHVEQNSLNSTGIAFSDSGRIGSTLRRGFLPAPAPQRPHRRGRRFSTALGAVKHAPGARVLHHAPNSRRPARRRGTAPCHCGTAPSASCCPVLSRRPKSHRGRCPPPRRTAQSREPVAADHAEAQTVGGIALPARFQLQILGPVGDKAALGAPSGTQTVDFQRFGARPVANGEILPSVKLESISKVTGALPVFSTLVTTSAAGLSAYSVRVWV